MTTTPDEPNDDLATFARRLFGKDKQPEPEPTDDPDRAYARALFTDND